MKTEPSTEQHIEAILQSLDGIRRAEPQPFLYTRLQARLDNLSAERNRWAWLSKPAFSFATLVLLLVLNIAVISSYLNTKKTAKQATTGIENFAKEYNLDESSVYTDKPEP